jgi:hypothetical protein
MRGRCGEGKGIQVLVINAWIPFPRTRYSLVLAGDDVSFADVTSASL